MAMTADQEEELRIREEIARRRNAKGDDGASPAPVDDNHWYTTGLKEFGKGTGLTVASLPDIVPNMWNTGVSAAELMTPEGTVDPEHLAKPWVGGREKLEEVTGPPVEGYEGWRTAGEKYGGMGAIGAAVGGLPGAVVGVGAAGLSDLGKLLGNQVDINLTQHPEKRRFEQLGEIAGSLVLPPVRPLNAISTRSKYASPRTPEIAAAAERQGVEPSVALLGNESAKTTKTEPRVYRRQQERLTELAGENVEGIGAGETPIEQAKAPIGASIQKKADTATSGVRSEIRRGQEQLTSAAGGDMALQDPWGVMAALDAKINDPRTTAQQKTQLQRVQNEYSANFTARDPVLAARLDKQEAAARRALVGAKNAAQRTAARNSLDQINTQRRANTAINEDRLRKFGSDLKARIEGDPGMAGFDIKPVRDAIEATRRGAAATRGFPEERWNATQAEMNPLYNAEEELGKRGSDPLSTGSDYNYFFGGQGDVSPGRLSAVAENLPMGETINAELAAQYGLKVTPNGVLDVSSGQWWGTLDDAARLLRNHGDPQLAQSLDDFALLAREMPQAPKAPEIDPATQLVSGVARVSAWGGNPLAMLAFPKLANPVWSAAKRYGAGVDPVAAMQRNNAQDIASLIARSVVPPTVMYDTQERNR